MKRIKYIATAIVCALAMVVSVSTATAKPITADAFHWDFWNSYEDNCTVTYQCVSNNGGFYKVIVVSADGRKVWRNDVSYVPYWYPVDMLAAMIGTTPSFSGVATCDIRSEVLSNESYFAKFTT